jgi:ribosomal protein S27AE
VGEGAVVHRGRMGGLVCYQRKWGQLKVVGGVDCGKLLRHRSWRNQPQQGLVAAVYCVNDNFGIKTTQSETKFDSISLLQFASPSTAEAGLNFLEVNEFDRIQLWMTMQCRLYGVENDIHTQSDRRHAVPQVGVRLAINLNRSQCGACKSTGFTSGGART